MRPWNERSGRIWDGSSAMGLDRDLCLGGFGAQPIGGLRAGGQAPTRLDMAAPGWLSLWGRPERPHRGVRSLGPTNFNPWGHASPAGWGAPAPPPKPHQGYPNPPIPMIRGIAARGPTGFLAGLI